MARFLLATLLALLGPSAAPGQSTRPAETVDAAAELAEPRPAAVIVIDGMIEDYSFRSLRANYAKAQDAGAEVVIIQINTYGGAVDAALEMTRLLRSGPLETVALVDDKAISAGSIIALACDKIIMEPGSLIGDAGVITMGGEMTPVQRAKAESLLLEEVAQSAERNGYDEELAKALIVMNRTVYYVEHPDTGDRDFVTAEKYAELIDAGWQDVEGVRVPLDGEDTLLTVRTSLAETIGLSAGTYGSAQEYAEAANLEIIANFVPTGGDRIVQFLAGSLLRGLLMTIFIFAAIAAVKTPGTGVAEVVAVGSLAIILGVPALVGLAQWYEILAVVLGLLLILVELFVLPGFGVAGISGLVLVVLGLVFSFVPEFSLPSTPDTVLPALDVAALGRGFAAVIGSMVASLLLWAWLGRFLPTLPYANRLVLADVVGAGPNIDRDGDGDIDADDAALAAEERDAWPPIGLIGVARSPLYPGGQVAFPSANGGTTILDVMSERGAVEPGQQVVVRDVSGNGVVVRPVPGGGA